MNVVAFASKKDGKWDNEKRVLPTEPRTLENDFASRGDSVTRILSLMEHPDLWALFDYPPARASPATRRTPGRGGGHGVGGRVCAV